MKRLDPRSFVLLVATAVWLTGWSVGLRAALLGLSDQPLQVVTGVEPNVVVSIDDSGSMEGCDMIAQIVSTSSVYSSSKGKKGLASATSNNASHPPINGLAYSPNTVYVVPPKADGTNLGTPTFTAAWVDGYHQSRTFSVPNGSGGLTSSNTLNLSTRFKPCWNDLDDWVTPSSSTYWNNNGEAAFYYKYTGTTFTNSNVNNQANYTKIVVGGATDVCVCGATTAAKQANFAIWFSYYRNRITAMKAAAGRAFTDPSLDGRIRLAQQTLFGYTPSYAVSSSLWADSDTHKDISLMRKFTGTDRTNFINWVYAIENTGSTPLRYTLDKVGRYYSNQIIQTPGGSSSTGDTYTTMTAINSPWAYDPGVTKDPEISCRRSYHVLMTDGQWNNAAGLTGNIDNTAAPYPVAIYGGGGSGSSYTPRAPYKDSNSDYLADNAFNYWVKDLRTDLPNDIAPYLPSTVVHPVTGYKEDHPDNDPATWQHMVNYTVSFGVNGTLDPTSTTNYNNLISGATSWGTDVVDDLWHAAIDSRGKYFAANNPSSLVSGFVNALMDITAQTASGTSVAQNTGSVSSGSRIYMANFNTDGWAGDLQSFAVDPLTGTISPTAEWKTATILNGQDYNTGRNIITMNSTTLGGVAFRWANLSTTQQNHLHDDPATVPVDNDAKGSQRLDFLRGRNDDEAPAVNNFRARTRTCGNCDTGVLGDIVNAAPIFVGAPAEFYTDSLEASPYSTFKTTWKNRKPVIYVGANDGMLHGIDASVNGALPTATSGKELIAYVPNKVYPKLSQMSYALYNHRYTVDGGITVKDAYVGGQWRTMLVGGLGKGGQGIYALDVTDPNNFTEGSAASVVKWEYTDTSNTNVGYTYGRPAIARLANGTWAAIFGNGHNNSEADGAVGDGLARLFIVNLATGALITSLSTGTGSVATPNGLGEPAVIDIDGNSIADYVYAGDIQGNLWKFDLTSNSSASWRVYYGTGGFPKPLITAVDGASVAQPITTKPVVGTHPSGLGGYMVYFGTGKYLEASDNTTAGAQTQSFYGVWDKHVANNSTPVARTNLLTQTVTGTAVQNLLTYRQVSDNPISFSASGASPPNHFGWVMDLPSAGEKQISQPLLYGGQIIFNTYIPATSSCTSGGSGWLMVLDAKNGGRLGASFDVDDDGLIVGDAGDTVGGEVAGGVQMGGAGTPGLIGVTPPGGDQQNVAPVSDLSGLKVREPPGLSDPVLYGRQSWRQIK